MRYSEIPKPILEYFVECFEYCDLDYEATAEYLNLNFKEAGKRCKLTPATIKKILKNSCDSKMNFRTEAAVLKSYEING